ncbi:MAG: hypothetical protein EAZ89_12615, partial [Bacteroidetes bacterium]
MNLTFTYSPWWLLLILPLAALLSWLMYRGTRDQLPRTVRILLATFRFVVLSVLGLLLLDPLLVSLTRVTYPPMVALLQDDSESLRLNRDSAFVKEQYPGLLKGFMGAFEGGDYDLDGYRFSDEVRAGLDPDSLTFDKEGTHIAQALRETARRYQNQNLGAIVLISDGIPTAGMNPLFAVEGMRQPIFTVLLGDTTPQRDVSIREVLFNEIAYLNTELPIRVKVQSEGFGPNDLNITLSDTDKTLGTQSLRLGGNQTQGEVSFLIKPEKAGLQSYQITVSRLDGEITYRNNLRRIYINVLETRVKIALFAGSPHPDLGALQQSFEREPGYELTQFILRRPGEFYTDPGAYNLRDFDLIILHNFPQSSADQAWVNKLVQEIKDQKKPVMFLVGQFADLRTMGPLFEYMAITPRNFNPNAEEAIPNFLPAYRNHSTFTFPEDWTAWANSMPPLYRNQSSWQAKATAEVFATARIKNISLDYPVFALQNYLGRKNMVLLGENFWRMRAYAFTEKQDFEYFDAWLFNTIKWLTAVEDKRRFKVDPARRVFSSAEPASLKGQAYDDSYNPLPGVEIKVKLRGPDGKENEYYLNESSPAQYDLEIGNLSEGAYSYTAEGRKNDKVVGED